MCCNFIIKLVCQILFGQTQQLHSMCQTTDVIHFLKASDIVSFPFLSIDVLNFVSLPKVFKIVALDQEDTVFSASLNVDDIGEIVKKCGYVTILGENFGSRNLHRNVDSQIFWPVEILIQVKI